MSTRKPKTKLLASLMKALQKTMYANEHNIPPASTNEFIAAQRRQFLKKAGKAIAAVTILGAVGGCSKMLETITPEKHEGMAGVLNNNATAAKKIVIVGSGIAGLHAAYTLKQKGCTAQIYEASSRTGGRIYSTQNILGNGLYTELGGEFIDSGHKDMLQLARTFNLTLIDTNAPSEAGLIKDAFYFNGIQYTEQQVIDVFSAYATQIKADIRSLSSVIDVDNHTANDVMFDNMSIASYFDRIGLTGWLRELLDVAYLTEYGRSIDTQTSLNFLFLISPKVSNGNFEIFGDSDERYKILGGNQQVCEKLAGQLTGQINLNHELIAITKKNNNSYDVDFKINNTTNTVNCDILLLTLPFSILKNIPFQPGWPSWKQNAISNLGYGNNSKLMLGFTRRFWRDGGYQGNFFTDSALQIGWDNSLSQSPVTGGLTIYSGGAQSLAVGNGTVQQQVNQHLPLLNQIFPGTITHYNNKAERFIWPTHKWTKASYSCFYPGQYTSLAGNEMKPVENIFFAGEHCSYNFQGYMNGGAETGRRAAENIVKALTGNVVMAS